MELDYFIQSSLQQIIKGMRDFNKTEEELGKFQAATTDRETIETANVFPELSGASDQLKTDTLLKAKEVEGYKGRSTIMVISYEVTLAVTDQKMQVIEGFANAGGLFGLKANAEKKAIEATSQKLSFTVPLELPFFSRAKTPKNED